MKSLEAQLAMLWWSQEAAEVIVKIPSWILLFPLYEKVTPKQPPNSNPQQGIHSELSSFAIRNSGYSFPVYNSIEEPVLLQETFLPSPNQPRLQKKPAKQP